MKRIILFAVLFLVFLSTAKSQSDNFITQYDPYVISLKKFTFYHEGDEPVSAYSNTVVVITGNVGGYKNAFIRFITGEKLAYELTRDYENGMIQEVSMLDKRGVLIPPVKDITGNNFLELTISGYSDLTETDYNKIKLLAEAESVPVSTSMFNSFNGIYSAFQQKGDVVKPADTKWAEAEAFVNGMRTRQALFLGTITLNVPLVADVRRISGGQNLVAGDKAVTSEDTKNLTSAIVSFRQLKDENMVYETEYYKKLYDYFNKFGGDNVYRDAVPGALQELTDFQTMGFKDQNDVYVNPEAKKQLGYLLQLLIAALPVKADTVEVSTSIIPLETQVAIDYFKENLTQDRTRFNKYIYETYILSDLNRAKLNRDIDRIRKYYNYR